MDAESPRPECYNPPDSAGGTGGSCSGPQTAEDEFLLPPQLPVAYEEGGTKQRSPPTDAKDGVWGLCLGPTPSIQEPRAEVDGTAAWVHTSHVKTAKEPDEAEGTETSSSTLSKPTKDKTHPGVPLIPLIVLLTLGGASPESLFP
ncbi:uncharacterized protein LOC143271616 isoform X1 [Peromyscus maniculatus bairdii]|uniref:uncharacterized protein LOC143271616 isoform X1 n=1 Tax=Peromyscus maniculatus bairdii TaxID=230844 RepID=UPI003FD084EB